MSDIVHNPMFWLIAIVLPGAALINLAASMWVRQARRDLLVLVKRLWPEASPQDRTWLWHEVDRSKGTHLLIASPLAPFAILGAVALGVYEGWRGAHETYDGHVKRIQGETALLEKDVYRLVTGEDADSSKIWNSPDGQRLGRLADHIENWNHPVAMLWIIGWLVVASPLLLGAYFVVGSLKPVITNMWAPLREPIAVVLRHARA